VIVDMPHAWSHWTRQTFVSADEIVLVATPDLASLRNTKNMIDLLRGQRPNDTPPRLVLNQVGVPKRPEIPLGDFAAAVGVEPTIVIPFDPLLFGTASNNGQMLAEAQPNAKASEAIRQLAEVITGRRVQQSTKKAAKSFLPFLNRKAS
jgi:pilus assembly protein CpaE